MRTSLLGLALVGCDPAPPTASPAPTPPASPSRTAGHPSDLNLDALPYADAESRRAFMDLVEATATGIPDGWLRRHVRRGDGTVSVRWCSPAVPETRCTTGSVELMEDPGVAWRTVSVFPLPDEGGLGGLGWEAGDYPTGGAWGLAQQRVRSPTDPSRPSGWWVGARQRTQDGMRVVPIGDAASWTIDGQRIQLPPATPDAWTTPDGIQAAYAAQQAALERAVSAELDKGLDRCVDTPPPSAGCQPRPLSPEQQTALREELRRTLAQRKAAVEAHGEVLSQLLRQTAPPRWPAP